MSLEYRSRSLYMLFCSYVHVSADASCSMLLNLYVFIYSECGTVRPIKVNDKHLCLRSICFSHIFSSVAANSTFLASPIFLSRLFAYRLHICIANNNKIHNISRSIYPFHRYCSLHVLAFIFTMHCPLPLLVLISKLMFNV